MSLVSRVLTGSYGIAVTRLFHTIPATFPLISLVALRNYITQASKIVSDERGLPMTVDITISAEQRLREIIKDKGEFLRITVESGGCHGFQYRISLDRQFNSDDVKFERNGAKIVVDETSLPYLSGSQVDYTCELIGSAFRVVNNPVAGTGCGCGVSFEYRGNKNK